MKLFTTLLFVLSAFSLSACAPDRDADDYAREEADRDRARAERISGVYVGMLKSERTGEDLGPIGLQVATANVPSDLNTTKPVLTGELVFQTGAGIPLVFTQGFFDPNTGRFQLSLSLTSSNEDTNARDISIDARVEGDSLTGRISVLGESSDAGIITLSKRPEAKGVQEYMTNEGLEGPEVQTYTRRYTGASEVSDSSYDTTLLIDNTRLSRETQFASLFMRQKYVQATVTLSRERTAGRERRPWTKSFVFDLATFDASNGVIDAIQGRDRIRCVPKAVVNPTGPLDCVLYVRGAENPLTLEITFTPERQ